MGYNSKGSKLGLEFSFEDYTIIDEYCKTKKIDWSASAWDINSQNFLKKFNLPFNKIASPMLGNLPLLKVVADEKKKTFISTGMSNLDEIDVVVEIFKNKKCDFELMHCNSTYPLKDQDANIKMYRDFKKKI